MAAAVVTGLILAWWGFSLRATVVVALVVACPVAMLYAWTLTRRALKPLEEPVPRTRGVTIGMMAPIYDAYCPLLGLGLRFRRETLGHVGLKAGEHVLDVGCGTGVLTRLAAEAAGQTGQAIGIDPAPGMIAVARRNATAAASRAVFRLAAIERLPFPDARFDLVLSSFMLHHLPPEVKRAGLSEVYRVLRAGGRLLAVDIDRPKNPLWWLLLWPLRFFSFTAPNLRGELPAYLRAAGFAPVELRARKGGLLSFWLATKPSNGPGSTQ